MIIPVVHHRLQGPLVHFITKTPPASVLLKQAARLAKGSGEPNRNKVGKVTMARSREIAELKMPDLNAAYLEAAMSMVAGTARSMGIDVVEEAEGDHGKAGVSASRGAADEVDAREHAPYDLETGGARWSRRPPTAKFDETIERRPLRLGVDPRHADQQVRGTVVLPNGTAARSACSCSRKGEKEKEAEDAGADFVGADEFLPKIKERLDRCGRDHRHAGHDGRGRQARPHRWVRAA